MGACTPAALDVAFQHLQHQLQGGEQAAGIVDEQCIMMASERGSVSHCCANQAPAAPTALTCSTNVSTSAKLASPNTAVRTANSWDGKPA